MLFRSPQTYTLSTLKRGHTSVLHRCRPAPSRVRHAAVPTCPPSRRSSAPSPQNGRSRLTERQCTVDLPSRLTGEERLERRSAVRLSGGGGVAASTADDGEDDCSSTFI